MNLAIFDLDNTLLSGDSDYLWGQFLVEKGIVDGAAYEAENLRFYEEYKAGKLDIFEFLAFSLRPLSENSAQDLRGWREEFVATRIHPIIAPGSAALLQRHRDAGDFLLIITATNRFVTEPIAGLLEVDHLLATEPEIKDGHYTGKVIGIPCFQQGKVERLRQWMDQSNHTLENSWFYSDSHNDLPLLEKVTHPVAVDPDEQLSHHAQQKGWSVISLREGNQAIAEH